MSTGPIPDEPPPYAAVAFDCDSTLSAIEGIDELAGDRKPEIAALTRRAMAGELPLESVYSLRLELLRPGRDAVEDLGRKYVAALLPHARELVLALHALAKPVWILSGGLRPAVLDLARELEIPDERVLAVEVRHDAAGRYGGFDESSPLATSGGKLASLERIARAAGSLGVVFVGDGVTDLEAAPEARRFIAFGGVVKRSEVFARAQVNCDSGDLAALLPLLCSADEIRGLAQAGTHAGLLAAAKFQP